MMCHAWQKETCRASEEMPAKDKCKRGHPLTPDNVRIIRNANGTSKRRCVTCGRATNREYQRRLRQKSHPASPSIKTFADKLAEQIRIEGECRLWTGQLQKQHPVIIYNGKYRSVRKILYELKFGAVKRRTDTSTTCGHATCVFESHFRGAQARDREAQLKERNEFGERIMRLWPDMLAFTYRRCEGICDAEDVLMDTVAAIYSKLSAGREVANLPAFMKAAVKRRIIDRLRHREIAALVQLTEAHEDIPAPPDTTDPQLVVERQQSQHTQYRSVIQRVRYWGGKQVLRVLQLKLQGDSAVEIGAKLGIAIHTVERYMTVARRISLSQKQRDAARTADESPAAASIQHPVNH